MQTQEMLGRKAIIPPLSLHQGQGTKFAYPTGAYWGILEHPVLQISPDISRYHPGPGSTLAPVGNQLEELGGQPLALTPHAHP